VASPAYRLASLAVRRSIRQPSADAEASRARPPGGCPSRHYDRSSVTRGNCEGATAATCRTCSDRTSGHLGHEFGRRRYARYVRGGPVAASSYCLVLLGAPFEDLLGLSCRLVVRPALCRPSCFILVPEARRVLGRCRVERSFRML
jgi:hypothetical protein